MDKPQSNRFQSQKRGAFPMPVLRVSSQPMQRAALIMFVAMSLIPLGDSAGKLLTSTYGASPLWVASSRFFLAAVMIAPFVPRSAYTLLRNWRIWLRALILAAGITWRTFSQPSSSAR